ncbi:MAG: zf-HC2 domain-containing protein [Calditrichaeota bacterium]|nr:MAG: zf-HC2 domain-containing protein [Calditrichota bacterium]
MKHKRLRKLISLYFDNALPSRQQRMVEQHLAECKSCFEFLATIRSIRHDISPEKIITPKPYFAARVMAEYAASGLGRFWSYLDIVPRPLILFSFALSIFFLSLFTFSSINNDMIGNAWTQFYEEQTLPLETNDELLEFAILNNSSPTDGE